MSADVDAVDDAEGDGWDATRRRVLERDDYECRFCGMSDDEHRDEHGRGLSAHHIIPDGDGGEDTPTNLITVCQSCHRTLESTHAKAVAQLASEREGENARAVATFAFQKSKGQIDFIDDKLGEFYDGHPTFREKFGIYDEWGDDTEKRSIESHTLRDMVGDVSSEWAFLVNYGYKLGALETSIDIDSWGEGIPDNDALAESDIPDPKDDDHYTEPSA